MATERMSNKWETILRISQTQDGLWEGRLFSDGAEIGYFSKKPSPEEVESIAKQCGILADQTVIA